MDFAVVFYVRREETTARSTRCVIQTTFNAAFGVQTDDRSLLEKIMTINDQSHLLQEVRALERELEQRKNTSRSLPKSVLLAYRQTIANKYAVLQAVSLSSARRIAADRQA